MSSKDASDVVEVSMTDDNPNDAGDHAENLLARKLSNELSNWRRQRSVSRPRRPEGPGSSNMQSEPARTIRVRGHETLVVRKPKLASKPPVSSTPETD